MAGRRLRVQAWRLASGVALLVMMAAGLLWLAVGAAPALGASLGAGAVGAVLLAAAYVVAARPARATAPSRLDRVDASAPLVRLLLTGVSLLLVGMAGLGTVTLLSPELLTSSRRTSPVVGLVLLALTLGSAWWLLGFVVGTARARLDLTAAGLHYRAGRTDRLVAWSDVESVALTDGAQRVTVRVRDGEPLRFSVLLFDVVPSGLVKAVEDARRRHRGSGDRPGGPAPGA